MAYKLEKWAVFYTFQEMHWHLKTVHLIDTGCSSRTTIGSDLFRKHRFSAIHSHIFIIKRLQFASFTFTRYDHLYTVIMY